MGFRKCRRSDISGLAYPSSSQSGSGMFQPHPGPASPGLSVTDIRSNTLRPESVRGWSWAGEAELAIVYSDE